MCRLFLFLFFLNTSACSIRRAVRSVELKRKIIDVNQIINTLLFNRLVALLSFIKSTFANVVFVHVSVFSVYSFLLPHWWASVRREGGEVHH